MSRWSPLGALAGGLVAGFAGALAQSLYFAWTRELAPRPSSDAFEPVEPEQRHEPPTQTVARRFKEHLVHAGPLAKPERAAQVVHLAFGSAWGGVYGLVAGTLPSRASVRGGLAFGAALVCVGVYVLAHSPLLAEPLPPPDELVEEANARPHLPHHHDDQPAVLARSGRL